MIDLGQKEISMTDPTDTTGGADDHSLWPIGQPEPANTFDPDHRGPQPDPWWEGTAAEVLDARVAAAEEEAAAAVAEVRKHMTDDEVLEEFGVDLREL